MHFYKYSGTPDKAHTSMAGWSMRLVGAVCHGFTCVIYFYALVNDFENFDCICGSSIAQIRPNNPAIANYGLKNIFAHLEGMSFSWNLPDVVALLRRVKR